MSLSSSLVTVSHHCEGWVLFPHHYSFLEVTNTILNDELVKGGLRVTTLNILVVHGPLFGLSAPCPLGMLKCNFMTLHSSLWRRKDFFYLLIAWWSQVMILDSLRYFLGGLHIGNWHEPHESWWHLPSVKVCRHGGISLEPRCLWQLKARRSGWEIANVIDLV